MKGGKGVRERRYGQGMSTNPEGCTGTGRKKSGKGEKRKKEKGKGKGRKMMNDNVAQLATGSKSVKSKMNGMQAIVNSVEQAKHVAFEQTKLQYADSTRTDGGGKAISS